MDLKLLRESTRPEHEATEAALPLMTADLSRETYAQLLMRFYVIVSAWDAFAAQHSPAPLAELVARRRRSGSLQQDLAHCGATIDPHASSATRDEVAEVERSIEQIVGTGDEAEYRFLGAMYVFEGSTLGGRFIAEHVASVLQLTPGQGDSFFRGYGEHTIPMWREFQAVLSGIPDRHSAAVIASADRTFVLFRQVIAQIPSIAAHPQSAQVAS